MKNSNPSHLTSGKFYHQLKTKFCSNFECRKIDFSKKRSEMEDNQQRLPFFLRIHAHSGKYHIIKTVSENFCQMVEC